MSERGRKLVGISEISALAGVTRQAVVNWRSRHLNFPKPLAELQNGSVWDLDVILSWLKNKDTPMTQFAERQPVRDASMAAASLSSDNISVAVDLLLEEMEVAIEAIESEGAQAFQRGDYMGVKELAEKASQATAFRHRIKEFEGDWYRLRNGRVARTLSELHQKRTLPGRAPRGQRTPEESYRIPLLESIAELGGRGEVPAILDRLGKKMQAGFNEYDLAPVPSNPTEVRWKNAAKWCRNTLVKDGLLVQDSPRGVWEITDAGRQQIKNF